MKHCLSITRLAQLGAALALAGCAASTPAPVLLALPPALAMGATSTAPSTAPSASGAAPLLAVRRIGIPEYLTSRRVRYRADASTLAEWPNTFWAERIEIGVAREFNAALRARLPSWGLCDATCGDQLPALSVQVEMVPMDYVRRLQRLQAKARITLSSAGAQPGVLQAQEFTYDLPAAADTPQAHAEALTDLLNQVAASTAAMVSALPRSAPAAGG